MRRRREGLSTELTSSLLREECEDGRQGGGKHKNIGIERRGDGGRKEMVGR